MGHVINSDQHEVLVMILRTNHFIIVLSYIIFYNRKCTDASSSESDDSLKEALVLVDILRSEYIKNLRENVENILRTELESKEVVEQSTCAATTEGPLSNTTQAVNSTSGSEGVSVTELSVSSGPVSDVPQRRSGNFEHPLRKMYRRFDYDGGDPFGDLEPTAATTTPPPPETTTKPRQETTAASSSANTVSAATPSPNNRTRANMTVTPYFDIKNSNALVNEAVTKTSVKKTKKQITKSSPDFERIIIKPKGIKKKDPVRDQIAQELINEIKHISPEETLRTDPKRQSSKKKSSKMKPFLQPKGSPRDLAKDYVKTTRRIHLERSTRFPIPLPENHAFCYTNPKSALCRTPL